MNIVHPLNVEASVFSKAAQAGSPTAPPQWNNFMSAGMASNHIRLEHLLCFLLIHLRITVCRIIFACNQRFWNNVIITIISILKIITTSTGLIFIISWSPSRITQHSSLHAKKGYPPNLPECPLIFPPTSSATCIHLPMETLISCWNNSGQRLPKIRASGAFIKTHLTRFWPFTAVNYTLVIVVGGDHRFPIVSSAWSQI